MENVFEVLDSTEDRLADLLSLTAELTYELASDPENVETLNGHVRQFAEFVNVCCK